LVKAYDTANHALLLQILEKFGTPPELVDCIRRLYVDIKISLKIGKEKLEILQTVGVKQGDPMAAVLFLFLMATVVEIIDKEWERNQIECVEFCRESDGTYKDGQIFRHNIKKCNASKGLVRFRINGTYYVDDIAALFRTRRDINIGLPIIQSILSDLGMEMHVGSVVDGKRLKSKTECIYFPPHDYFKRVRLEQGTRQLPTSSSDPQLLPPESQATDENKSDEERFYLNCEETKDVAMNNGTFVTFTDLFKYLGTHLHFTLTDDYDIEIRMNKANQAFGAMRKFFEREEIDLFTKYLVFLAIHINILLWGVESWALHTKHIKKLQIWINRKIRSILRISMHQVKNERITEEELWERFHNISSVQVMIDSRRMKFLAKVVRSQRLAPARQMLIAYVDNPRPQGRPIISCKASMIESLQRFGKYNGLHIDDKGSLKLWYVEACNDPFWGNCLERFKRQDPDDKVPPERPAHPECPDEEEHHRYNTRSSTQPPPPTPPRNQPPSPPRNPKHDSTRDDRSRGYDPEGVGHNLRDSLGIFGLGPSAVWMEVRAEFRQFSRIYHPDKHNSTRTKMSNDEAKAFFQLFNNARDFLEDHFRRTGHM
jgi:hypothetical protein